ncbi:MAG: hypothetical protein ACK5V3_01550, partial [Bdellovibrionales bacterium]
MASKTKKHHKKTTEKPEIHEHVELDSQESPQVEKTVETEHKEEASAEFHSDSQEAPIRVDFPYSEVVRYYVPDAMA